MLYNTKVGRFIYKKPQYNRFTEKINVWLMFAVISFLFTPIINYLHANHLLFVITNT